MVREMLSAFTDPLAGTYLCGWMLLIGGALGTAGSLVIVGIVMIIMALLAGGYFAYVE